MPRRYNPRAARARAKALRAEITEMKLRELRDAKRERRAVANRLRAVPGYERLLSAQIDMEVQAKIDEIELHVLNLQRQSLGLNPLDKLPPE